jgi:aspartate/methionine/tyrosine aminotransferase
LSEFLKLALEIVADGEFVQPTTGLKLNRFLADLAPASERLLCASDVEPFRLGEVLALADEPTRALWQGLELGYAEPGGHRLLRSEVASLYPDVEEDEVAVCAGADDAIFLVLNAILGPGDHAIVVWPAYEPLHEVAAATGARVTRVPLEPEGWTLGLEAVRAGLRANTRAIVVNFPHNPTGALPPPETLDGLITLAAEAGAHLVSDEVYRLLEYDLEERLPAVVELGRSAVSIGAVSKSFGLAGVRIGWVATHDRSLLRRIASVGESISSGNSAPSEVLALIALRARERVLARSRALLLRNLALVDSFLAEHAELLDWVRPRAGCVGFPRVRTGSADVLAARLLEQERVLIVPGSIYGVGGGHFRLGFGRADLPDALARFARVAAGALAGSSA